MGQAPISREVAVDCLALRRGGVLLFQVFGWDGGCQEGADAVKEGVGAVAGVAGVRFVELRLGVVVRSDAPALAPANLSAPFRLDQPGFHDMEAEHTSHASMAFGCNAVEMQSRSRGVQDGVVSVALAGVGGTHALCSAAPLGNYGLPVQPTRTPSRITAR